MRRIRYKLEVDEWRLLVEATRRYSRFGEFYGNKITKAWTGLGCASWYKAAVLGGYMEPATGLNPGYMIWWRLTRKGARIVRYWLNCGYDHVRIEADELPPQQEDRMVP